MLTRILRSDTFYGILDRALFLTVGMALASVQVNAQITTPTTTLVNSWLGASGVNAYAVMGVIITINIGAMVYRRFRS